LILRAAQDDDLAQLFCIFSDASAMQYWSTLPHETLDDTRPLHTALMQPGPRRYFVIEFQGRVAGTGGVHNGTDFGFILRPDLWGIGIAREAMTAIIQHIWDTTDLPHLTADAGPHNLASVGLLTRLGFHVTGHAKDTFCLGGVWSDSVYLTLPRPN
jgi:ribosomal-protein-alanine N-acetyltransferase